MSRSESEMQFLHSLRSKFSQALKDFAHSSSSFQILHTIPSTAGSHASPISTRTLYVLDSSFNPPSKAHVSLVKTALASSQPPPSEPSEKRDRNPRVLFLLATVNADKKPKPADFEDRIVMMALAAEHLRSSFSSSQWNPSSPTESTAPIIDIGITKKPYFVDKANSITASGLYSNLDRPDGITQQIHLTGFDTLLRIFTPKYYPDHHPPLSALEPFLKYHRVRATVRVDKSTPSENLRDVQQSTNQPSNPGNPEAGEPPDLTTLQGQNKYLDDIRRGSLEQEGMKREWAEQVDLEVDESGETYGVSSTKIREAVAEGKWEEVNELVGEKVGRWVRENELYVEGKEGGKL